MVSIIIIIVSIMLIIIITIIVVARNLIQNIAIYCMAKSVAEVSTLPIRVHTSLQNALPYHGTGMAECNA